MAPTKFEYAVEYVLGNEGGFVDDPLDRGGCTNFGITLKTAQDYGVKNCQDLAMMPRTRAIEIYKSRYWKFETIDNWAVAAKLFDIYVNLPPNNAVIIFQRAARASGAILTIDGLWGAETRKALNSCPAHVLIPNLISQLERYYNAVIKYRPEQVRFIKGWFARAQRVPVFDI